MSLILGRERDTESLLRMLNEGARLITLRGPGGIGKTTLALHLMHQLQHQYDHVLHVDLSALNSPEQVLATIASQLPHPERQHTPLRAIAEFTSGTRLLLVLDNFEHLTGAAAHVAEVLEATSTLRIIVTSRTALHLHEEHEYPLGPLTLPDPQTRVEDSSAAQLFEQRARLVQPGFELNHQNRQDVKQLVHALEGVPLAIELAASRLRTYALPDLLVQLEHPLAFLKADFHDRPQRLRSLRAAVEWSYDLLSLEDRELFECCSVFEGSFTPDALAYVWGAENELDRVGSLIEQSFLSRVDAPGTRWKMLQPLRELAQEKLRDHPQAETWRERHARYYLSMTEIMRRSTSGRTPADAQERLLPDYANMRAGLIWAIERQQAEVALRYLHGIVLIWVPFGLLSDGHLLSQRALALPARGLEHLRPQALHTAVECLLTLNHQPEALAACARELCAASREAGDIYQELNGLRSLAIAEHWAGRSAESLRMNQDVIERCAQLIAHSENQDAASLDQLRTNSAYAMNNSVFSLLELGQYDQALGYATSARDQLLKLGHHDAETRNTLVGHAHYHLGRWLAAAESYLSSLDFSLRRGYWVHARNAARGFGMVVAATGDDALAVRLTAFADRLSLPHHSRYIESMQAQVLSQLHDRLGEVAYQQAWREGAQWTPEEARRAAAAFAQTLKDMETPSAPTHAPAALDTPELTTREREVLILLVQGHPDRRIAKLLNISPGTASKHVGNMLGKLGLRNRVDLARWALERGIRT
ncbi:LuxR C-terminal-related transcriptional regulator [Deinococcus deserti]|uniref:Putative transcriptional regulator, LuxR family protein n=1 Tax=Deinococcus deserti (strain DSM 17065 / CIP 109153 / LMG 22923 / VCD115) TaxID=546414 RepID=C1CZY7_DEIDV|nr:LuxR C-terminal-related transcriptional regulator [Deinococcus deserti]ACO45239.1 putative transcriptional regulator, LuxR family protein [Deinococcus deserti VCD115]